MSNPIPETQSALPPTEMSSKALKEKEKEDRKAAKKVSKMMTDVATELGAEKSVDLTEGSRMSTKY